MRMGEARTARDPGEVLCSIGLGSCVGLVLLDAGRAVAGLAHVVLPAAAGHAGAASKFADSAVPALAAAVAEAGGRRRALQAVIVGGASMFALRPGGARLDVGGRNVAAIRTALAAAAIPLRAEDVGGRRGRTLRVRAGGPVTVRGAGEPERVLWAAAGARA